MLGGEYGAWFYGEREAFVGPDKIESSPGLASGTRYGISVIDQSTLGGGGWSLRGGIVGRVERPGASIELFGKRISRVHSLKETVSPQDHSFEFFLLIRPTVTRRGSVVKHWSFSNEELARTVPPAVERSLRAANSGAELESELTRSQGIYVDGYLSFDERGKIATVTITGLARPLEERVDLSKELR